MTRPRSESTKVKDKATSAARYAARREEARALEARRAYKREWRRKKKESTTMSPEEIKEIRMEEEMRTKERENTAHLRNSKQRALQALDRGEVAVLDIRALDLRVGRYRLNFTPIAPRVRVGVNDIIIFSRSMVTRVERVAGVVYDHDRKELVMIVDGRAKVRRSQIKGVSAYGVW